MFKVEYKLFPKPVTQMFSNNKNTHSHDTGNSNVLRVFTGTNSFAYLSARLWNAIVSIISINVTLSQLKAMLKINLLHNPYIFVLMLFSFSSFYRSYSISDY